MNGNERKNEEIGTLFRAAKRYSGLYRQIGIHDRDDIIQGAMMKLLTRKNDRRVGTGWMYNAVKFAAVDASRQARRELELYQDCQNQVLELCQAADRRGWIYLNGSLMVREGKAEIDMLARIEQLLSEMSPALKQVLMLHAEGYSYMEIGELTKTNVGTVRSRLHYARKKARALLAGMI